VLFKNFDVRGGEDRTLIYLTLYTQACLSACHLIKDKAAAKTALYQMGVKTFVIPGDSGWTTALGGMFPAPQSREEGDAFKAYFKQARSELGERILDLLYTSEGGHNKWWMCFAKKKFMGKELKD
jgi:actin related protein 2/3 complex subunit 3